MAKVLDTHTFAGRGGGGSKYDRFLDGRVHKLKLGTDCSSNPTSARTYFYGLAAKRGIRIHTDVASFPGHIVVQAETEDAA